MFPLLPGSDVAAIVLAVLGVFGMHGRGVDHCCRCVSIR